MSADTIYPAIYVHARGELKRTLAPQLWRGRVAQNPNRASDARKPRFVDPMTTISQRPDAVHSRPVPGHWQGHLIPGPSGGSAMETLVERITRFVVLGHLVRERSLEAVRDCLITTIQDFPASLRGSLTWDQGPEMSEHRAFALATSVDVYFADAGSPWQRGTNENTDGLLRQHFPEGTDLGQHPCEDLLTVARELNGHLQKTSDWDTPAERLTVLLEAA